MMTDSPMKRCSKCKREFPATAEYFPPRRQMSDGFDSWCRDCRRQYKQSPEYKAKDQARRQSPEYKAKDQARRQSPEYKAKQRESDQRVERKAKQKEYKRKPEVKAKSSEYNHRPEVQARERARRKSAEYIKKDRERNQQPDRIAQQRARQQTAEAVIRRRIHRQAPHNKARQRAEVIRRRARKQNLPDNFAREDWERALDYFEHKCPVCHRPLGGQLSGYTIAADHWIPLSSPDCPGTVPTNIIPLCHGNKGCNNSKNKRSGREWLIWRYSEERAAEILARIEAYFEWIKQQGGN